jgi:acetyl-CoA carboxylase biotin carboxyl carrier protein
MQLDHDQLHKLLAFLGDSDIQELRLEGDDFRLEVRRNLPGLAPQVVHTPLAAAVPAAVPAAAPSPAAAVPSAPPPAAAAVRSDLLEITAPMVATFYRAPSPGDPPFVEVGARISTGQTVCILEAMKLMNELESEVSGEVVEILVENGTPVEFGQVLMRVKPG